MSAFDKVNQTIQHFEKGIFDIKQISNNTGASEATVRTQLYKWKKEKGIPLEKRKNKEQKMNETVFKNEIDTNKPVEKEFETTVTKTEFMKYERVRRAGVTNMLAVDIVRRHSGLKEEKIMQIIKEYRQLAKKYPEVLD